MDFQFRQPFDGSRDIMSRSVRAQQTSSCGTVTVTADEQNGGDNGGQDGGDNGGQNGGDNGGQNGGGGVQIPGGISTAAVGGGVLLLVLVAVLTLQ